MKNYTREEERPTRFGEQLGKQIRAMREARGYTGEELARRCGVQKSQISKIEQDATCASTRLLLKLAEVFKTELSFRDPIVEIPDVFLSQLKSVTDIFKNQEAARDKIYEAMQGAKKEIKLLLIRGVDVQGKENPIFKNILEKKGTNIVTQPPFCNPGMQEPYFQRDFTSRSQC